MLRFKDGDVEVTFDPATGLLTMSKEPASGRQLRRIIATIHEMLTIGLKDIDDDRTGESVPYNDPNARRPIKPDNLIKRLAALMESMPEPLKPLLVGVFSGIVADSVGDQIPICLHFIRPDHYFRTEDGEVWQYVGPDQGENVKTGEVRTFEDIHTKVTNLGAKQPAPEEQQVCQFVDGMLVADYSNLEPGSWFSDGYAVYQRLHEDVVRKHGCDGNPIADGAYDGRKEDLLFLGLNAVKAWNLVEAGCKAVTG